MTQEALKQALEWAEAHGEIVFAGGGMDAVNKMNSWVTAIKEALAQPEQEPVAWMWDINNGAGYSSRGIGFYQTDIPFAKHTPLYTTPPQRTWVGLTDEEVTDIVWNLPYEPSQEHIRAIEAKLKDKNSA